MRAARPTPYGWLWAATTSGALGEGVSLSVLPLRQMNHDMRLVSCGTGSNSTPIGDSCERMLP